MGCSLEIDLGRALCRRGLEPGGRVQQFVDSEALRQCVPYLPKITGGLERAGIMGTVPGSGVVAYNAPQARYLYYGVLMVGQETGSAWAKQGERKVLTDRALRYDKSVNPKAGKLWFERMKQEHAREILAGAATLAGGRAK